MSCEEALELIQRKLDHDLKPAEEAQLNNHLSHCQACFKEWQHYERLSQVLTDLPKVNPPRSVLDQLIPALQEDDKGTEKKNNAYFGKKGWMAAVLAACLLLALTLLWQSGLFQTDSPLQQYAGEGEVMEGQLTSIDSHFNVLETEQPTASDHEGALGQEGAMESFGGDLETGGDMEVRPLGEGERAWSPDGSYSAYIGPDGEDLRLDALIDGQMKPYYISINPESKEWLITEMRWLDEDRLYYVLYHPEKREYQYWIIVASQLQEMQLEGPVLGN